MEILNNARNSWRAARSSWLGLAGVMTGALILAVLFPAMANAADSVGRILAVKGAVTVLHEGAKTPVPGAKNAQVFLGDRLNTGKSSKVKLLMKDDSIVTLGQNSELVVDKFVYAPETSTRKSVLKLAKGMVRNLIAKSFSGLGSVFEVHTPTAVAGAMGTENLVWVFRGSELPTEIAGLGGGVTDISRIVLNSQFEGGAYMDYGSPGSIDWLRLAAPGGGTGDNTGNGGSGGFLVADNGGGEGGGPLNTLGVGISNDTQFGNEFGSVTLNNGLASFAPEGFGPTEPFILPPGTFNNLLGATDLSEGAGENGDDGNDGGDNGDGGDGGGRDGEGGEGGDSGSGGGEGGDGSLQGAKDQMQDTINNDQSGGLDGFSNDMNGDALGEFGQFADGGGDGGAGGGDGGAGGGDGTPNPDNNVNNTQPVFTVADTLGGLPGNSNAIFEDGFESGVFDETVYSGTNIGILPGYGSILPAGGSEMALVHCGPGNFGLLTLFLNLAAGNYNIVFDYNFTTNEGTGGNNYYNDFFRAFVTTSTGEVIDLAYASVNGNDFTNITNPGGTPSVSSETGWLNSSQVATLPAGESTLNFFVRDVGDTVVDSAVFLDNLQVIPTNGPATVFPIEMGVIAAGTGFVGIPEHTVP